MKSLKQLFPDLIKMSAARSRSALIPAAEALLRVDVRVLPLQGLPASVWDGSMPWGDGWARLDTGQTDPAARTKLAANLLCRGARARSWPREDWAADWLTGSGEERRTTWAETVAARLLLRGDPRVDLLAPVKVLIEQTPCVPLKKAPDSRKREDAWRDDALTWARRVSSVKRRPSPVPRMW
ncbi:hypothetical protein ACI79J_07505 [Geodermatophilus sp. SYSU D01062]